MSIQGINLIIMIIYQVILLAGGYVDIVIYLIIIQTIINLVIGGIYRFDKELSNETATKFFLSALVVPLIGFPMCIAGGFISFASNHT